MRGIWIWLLVFGSACLAIGQQATPTPLFYSDRTLKELEQLQKASLDSNYAYRRVAYLTNNIGPRLSGSAQAQRAVDYVAAEMKKAGLDVRLQRVMVPHWVRGQETGEIVEWDGMAPGTTQKIVLTALGGSVATPANGITADVVVVNNFDELNSLGRAKVQGKIVVFNEKFDRQLAESGFGLQAYGDAVAYRGGGAVAAARLGAVAVLVRSAGQSQDRLVHTGSLRYADNATKIPGAAISYEDAETLAYLAATGRVRVHITLTPETLPDVPSYNVIGEIRGTERPNEVVVLGGHLDSWDLGTGALDDASGVGAAMQAGFLIKFLKLKPKRTVRIIAFMNEENGNRGGRGYAEEQNTNLDNHFAAIEADLGASHPVGFQFAGKREAMPMFAPLQKVLADQGASQIQWSADEVGTDIAPLTDQGKVPSFAPWFDTRTYFNYHHTAADTFDKVDSKQLAEVSSVMAVLAYGLANMEQPIPR
ncbi:MAG TPA: M28 family peptidase [Pyrinomonadaceae bacterium]|nr:M28 family peptidase [Pyrinomonadaceae bacterium]